MPGAQDPNQPHNYRAYRVSPGGRISTAPIVLKAENDEDAIMQAQELVDGTGIEVWERARRVAVLPPKCGGDPR